MTTNAQRMRVLIRYIETVRDEITAREAEVVIGAGRGGLTSVVETATADGRFYEGRESLPDVFGTDRPQTVYGLLGVTDWRHDDGLRRGP